MGLKKPRSPYERQDVLLPAKVWRTADRADPAVAATCRNLGARGCRFAVEDARRLPALNVETPIAFSIEIAPSMPTVEGGGRVAWMKRERGEGGKVRLVVGVEFTSVAGSHQERIKAYLAALVARPP